MSLILLGVVLVVGVVGAVLPPRGAERVDGATAAQHAARPVLWWYLVRRFAPRGWRLAAVPGVLLLQIAAGIALSVAFAFRAVDLAIEWCARRAEQWSDSDS